MMTHRRRLLTYLIFPLAIIAALFLVISSVSAYDDISTSNDLQACKDNSYCYTQYKSKGGGLVWVWVPTQKINYAAKEWAVFSYAAPGATFSNSLSGGVDCTKEDTEGMFILGCAWHYSGSSELTGYFFPASSVVTKGSDENLERNYRADAGAWGSYPDGSFIYNGSIDRIRELFVAWSKHSYKLDDSDAEQRWKNGNFNYFCGSPELPDDDTEFASRTGAYYDSANSEGVSSYNTNYVDSDFVDGATDVAIELTVEAGGKAAIDFNSFLKSNSSDGGDTQYRVKHEWNCSYSFCTDFYDENFIPEWTDFHTDDDEKHSVIEESGKSTHYFFEIPEDAPVGETFTFCETIIYKKTGPEDEETGSTHACVKLTIGEASAIQGKTDATSDSNSTTSDWGIANEATPITETIQSSESSSSTANVEFQHYLRGSSTVSHSTDWTITAEITGGSDGGISISSAPDSSDSGTLTISDDSEHEVGGTRQYSLTISNNLTDVTTFKICETLNFQTTPSSDELDGWTKACYILIVTPTAETAECPVSGSEAPATGTKSYGETRVFAGAKNDNVSTFSQYTNTGVYAKPTDGVRFAHCYYPEAQAVMYTNTEHPQCETLGCSSYTEGYKEYVATKNEFTIDSIDDKVRDSGNVILNPALYYNFSSTGNFSINGNNTKNATFKGKEKEGDTTAAIVYSHGSNNYTVEKGSAGSMIKQTITSEENAVNTSSETSHSWLKREYQCSCGRNCVTTCREYAEHKYIIGSKGGSVTDSAWLYIPYNFNTSLGTNIFGTKANGGSETVILSNEEISVSAWVSLDTRSNSVTEGTYATEPPEDTAVQVVSFFIDANSSLPSGSLNTTDPCTHFGNSVNDCQVLQDYSDRSAWMGDNYPDYGGTKYDLDNSSVRVQNLPVGYKFCTAIGISHSDSGDDINSYTGPGGTAIVNDNWHVSDPTCRTIANRPNLQIWGGNFHTNGDVDTSLHVKEATGRLYGSWGEFALIVGENGSISGMSSGAALGYDAPYASSGERLGGVVSSIELYCNRSPLSIATVTDCSSKTGRVEASGISASADSLYRRLYKRYIDKTDTVSASSGTVNISYQGSGYVDTQSENYSANSYRLTVLSGNSSISASFDLPSGRTHIIYAKGDLTINSNLTIHPGPYARNLDIPQYIILADGNVSISGSVSQLDAWIIAPNGVVDTCADREVGAGVDSTACGTRLLFNGPVVAQSVILDRAAGAGAQESSGTYPRGTGSGTVTFDDDYNADPAEIFNLPISSFLWAYAQATKFAQVNTVYTRELAPRL